MNPQGDIYLVTGNTDMRKSINGLSLIVSDVLEMDPLSRACFIFCNRPRDKLKYFFGILMVFGCIIGDWKKVAFNGLLLLMRQKPSRSGNLGHKFVGL
jgi:hypothetical protein